MAFRGSVLPCSCYWKQREPANALFDLLVRDPGKCEAGEFVAVAVDEECAAEDEAHLLSERALEQRAIVDAGHLDPQEEAAARRGPLHAAGQVAVERAFHHGALRLVMRAQLRRDAIDDAAGQRAMHDALIEDAGGDVGGLLAELDLLRHVGGRHHPRHAQSRHQDLREAPQIDHPPVGVVGLDRPGIGKARHVLEVDRPVGIVFEDHEIVPPGGVQ